VEHLILFPRSYFLF